MTVTPISELEEGPARIRATIVNIAEKKPYYLACPECKSSVQVQPDGHTLCQTHGEVTPIKKSVLDLTLDDGKETIRGAVFDKVAEQILGLTADEAAKINMEMGDNAAAIKRKMGEIGKKREILADGRVKWNERNKRLEFIISNLIKIHPKNELESKLNELESKIM
ncbi:MAG: hypothetical protein KAR35_01030 [Candidatus Heimdallarchaeota archaeon]|nr:hypothetical protein [Candidatus Heimdallarchaeota archaeon]MCK5047937.1 hypothetical protein [Candidatus Heimdallarchaeota archaeon]